MHRFNSQKGFTLIELAVVAPILILILGTIIYSIITLTGQSFVEGSRAQMINDVQDALDRIESDVQFSGAYLATNNFTPTSPQGINNTNQKFNSISTAGTDTLILNSFFTTGNPTLSSRTLIYVPNTPFACADENIVQNQVMTMNTVYFVSNSSLWRRVVATNNFATAGCPGSTPWQQPSCAETTMASNASLCRVKDEQILTGVEPSDFVINYYLSASDTAPLSDAKNSNADARQIAIDKSPTLQITIKGSKSVGGQTVTQQASIRVTRSGSIVKYATPSS
jgi:type II secretory pathway pseudopilin PulG